MTPLVSIVICAYGKRALTERCLDSLAAALGPRLGGEWELVLVDNASPDDTAALFERWRDRTVVVHELENRNFAGGNNDGVAASHGEVIVLLNNDTIVPVGALEALVEEARRPDVGAVGARLVYPNGTLQHGGFAWRTSEFGPVPFHLFRQEPDGLEQACATYDLDVVTGACLALRRDVFLAAGGLDEGFVNGHEDVDLCLKIRLAGLRVVYRGDVAIVHDEGGTRGRAEVSEANEQRFARRWHEALDSDDELLLQLFGGRGGPRLGTPVYLADVPDGSRVSVEGQVGTLSVEAAEARGLLGALAAAGLAPAARDFQQTWLVPVLDEDEWAVLSAAHGRSRDPDAVVVQVPPPGRAAVRRADVVRVAAARPLPPGATALAPSTAVAAALRAGGAARVCVAPPAVPPVAVGAGGGGLLLTLPAHDPARAAGLLAAAAGEPQLTALPNVLAAGLPELAAPHRLARPAPGDRAFAALAAAHDVVAVVDDPFGRRAALAAAAGAVPVVEPASPAAEFLAGHVVVADGPLADALAAAAERHGDRAGRAAAAAAACRGDDAVAAVCALAG